MWHWLNEISWNTFLKAGKAASSPSYVLAEHLIKPLPMVTWKVDHLVINIVFGKWLEKIRVLIIIGCIKFLLV